MLLQINSFFFPFPSSSIVISPTHQFRKIHLFYLFISVQALSTHNIRIIELYAFDQDFFFSGCVFLLYVRLWNRSLWMFVCLFICVIHNLIFHSIIVIENWTTFGHAPVKFDYLSYVYWKLLDVHFISIFTPFVHFAMMESIKRIMNGFWLLFFCSSTSLADYKVSNMNEIKRSKQFGQIEWNSQE